MLAVLPMVNLHGKFTAMYTRQLIPPNHSFFLFGPRGTGKTTWLRTHFPHALWKNLLDDCDYLALLGASSLLKEEVEALPKDSWIVIDEVQRVPALLNVVHDLISLHGTRYKFVLSGSSARKLRRLDTNLLAGRAIERQMFPLTSAEMGKEFSITHALQFGTLPPVTQSPDFVIDILQAYVGTYLQQEIQQETMVANIAAFHRFLKVAAIMNGEVLNSSGVARDAAVARSTVDRYFEVLIDTLIGFRLPGWIPRLKVRERAAPKFYLFDCGVVRAIAGTLYDKVGADEVGSLLETLVLHELRAAVSYQGIGGELFYWRTPAGVEVDFIWSRGKTVVGIEVKSGSTWRKEYGKGLSELKSHSKSARTYGVYRGERFLKVGETDVLPVEEFFARLHRGEILGTL